MERTPQKPLTTLSIPKWGKPKPAVSAPSVFLGVANEAQRTESQAEFFITVEVRGLSKVPSGSYRLAYSAGAPLGDYLKRVKLRYAGMTNAVYDYANLEHGRCRMSYVPREGARIVIGPSQIGSAYEYQRSTTDAQQLAANMGKHGQGPAPRVVEVKKHRP